MKDELLPGLDRTLSGLLIDLDRRGLLDETLVVLLSEHGRTPKLALANGGGRDHWSRCYSVVMAGGGMARGRVVGRSDKIASDPAERRVSPKDILATIYHLLGIDPSMFLADRQGRPLPLIPEAEVIAEGSGVRFFDDPPIAVNRRDFKRLAELRLREAEALLRARHFSGAYYLGGYAIECAMKACIAKKTKRYDFPPKPKSTQEYYSHDLEQLVRAANLK